MKDDKLNSNELPVLIRYSLVFLLLNSAAAQTHSAETTQRTLNRTCFGCHNDKLKSGSLSMQGLKAADIAAATPEWEKILRKVRGGEMPPPAGPKLAEDARAALVAQVETDLDANFKRQPDPGTPSIHRLNRAEYSNAIRDLLALDLDHSATLPTDDSGYGFDNIGSVLTTSPMLLEKYLSTARRVARTAIGTIKPAPAIERYTPRSREALSTDFLPLSVRNGLAIQRYFPLDAEYSILVRMRGAPDANLPLPQLDIRVDGVRSKLLEANVDPAEENQATRNFEIRVPLTAGTHIIAAGLLVESLKSEAGIQARRGFGPPPAAFNLGVEYITIGGPFVPKGPGETASRKRIFSCQPTTLSQELPCARQILTPIARRAYRRPVLPTEITPLLKIFSEGRKDSKSFDGGIETALRAILVSPNFLFRLERSPAGVTAGTNHKVSDLELASRLSFFLWSSIPDDELLRLGSSNQLRPALARQIKRMLADPKANALVQNFAGQWLQLRNIASWRPDPDKFPQFDESLRASFQKESELFMGYIIEQDRSVLDLINADYTFLNDRLARHYGIPNIRGSYYRRVMVNPEERGGILSQGGILTVTSYPTRTSPVLRGKWVLENVLGSPPPPPPPDIPDLEDHASTSPKDLRAALEKHRANPACASCHSRLDPLGFSLENYDAVGRYRKTEGGATIDATGALPNGKILDGPKGLKQVLMSRQDEFVDCVAEKLLTYALGRGLEAYDQPTVRQVRRQAAQNGYRFSALVESIVNSVPFQMRRKPLS
jgi:mono/diheme cytochrome c family protein